MVSFDLHIPQCHSLKEKRAVIKPILAGARQRYAAAAAEVDHQELHQRAAVGVAVVGGEVGHVQQVLDDVERFVWSRPGVEVLSADRTWVETET